MILLTLIFPSRNPPLKTSPISSTVAHPLFPEASVFALRIAFPSRNVVVTGNLSPADGSTDLEVRINSPAPVNNAHEIRKPWIDSRLLLDTINPISFAYFGERTRVSFGSQRSSGPVIMAELLGILELLQLRHSSHPLSVGE